MSERESTAGRTAVRIRWAPGLRLRQLRLLPVLVVVGVIIWLIAGGAGGGGASGSPFTFAGTLPEVIHDFGASARVISITIRPEGIEYLVIGEDRKVHERDYGLAVTSVAGAAATLTSAPGIHDSTEPLTSGVEAQASVPLRALDPRVPAELLTRLHLPPAEAVETFAQDSWHVELENGADQYQSRIDGTDIEPVL